LWPAAAELRAPDTSPAVSPAVTSVVVSPDGRCMVSGGADGCLQLWSRASPSADWSASTRVVACRASAPGASRAHESEVNALALRDTVLLSGAADGAVKMWRAEVKTEASGRLDAALYNLRTMQADQEAPQDVMCVALPSESVAVEWGASGSQDGYVGIWDLASAQRRQRLKHRHWVMALEVAHSLGDSKVLVLAGCYDGSCVLWRADACATGNKFEPQAFQKWRQLSSRSEAESAAILSVDLCAARGGSHLAACGTNGGSIRVWRVGGEGGAASAGGATASADAPLVTHQTAHGAGVTSLRWRGAAAVSAAEEIFSAGEDGYARRWAVDVAGGAAGGALRPLQELEVQREAEVMCAKCTEGNGEVACAVNDGSVQVLVVRG